MASGAKEGNTTNSLYTSLPASSYLSRALQFMPEEQKQKIHAMHNAAAQTAVTYISIVLIIYAVLMILLYCRYARRYTYIRDPLPQPPEEDEEAVEEAQASKSREEGHQSITECFFPSLSTRPPMTHSVDTFSEAGGGNERGCQWSWRKRFFPGGGGGGGGGGRNFQGESVGESGIPMSILDVDGSTMRRESSVRDAVSYDLSSTTSYDTTQNGHPV